MSKTTSKPAEDDLLSRAEEVANAAVAKAKPARALTIHDIMQTQSFQTAVSTLVSEDAQRFRRIALNSLKRNPKLGECDPVSFCEQLVFLAEKNLEPDGVHAHLIPFRNNKKGIVECNLIIGYQGYVELVMRSGQVKSIHCDIVCEHDDFLYDRGHVVRHVIDFKSARGNAIAVYCIIEGIDWSKCEVMTVAEVEAVRACSKASASGPWSQHWGEMAKKTVFLRAKKWVPQSVDDRRFTSHVEQASSLEEMPEIL